MFFMSVPDQFNARAGLTFPVWTAKGVSLSLSGRLDGIPVTDVFGGSAGGHLSLMLGCATGPVGEAPDADAIAGIGRVAAWV